MNEKILYRPVRLLLEEAMNEVKEINSIDDLLNITGQKSLSCEYQGFDKRIGWDTYIILGDSGYPVGYLNQHLLNLKEK